MDTNGHDGARMSLNSLGSLFSETWNSYKERWQSLVEIVLLPTLVTILGYVLISIGAPFSVIGDIVVFVGWIIFAFSALPVIFSIHHKAGVDESYKATIGWFWPFVWVSILEILAVMGGSIMLIIPGIWLAIALSFMAYVFVIEQRRGIDALRQSKDYVKGYWWAVTGRVLLLGIIMVVATIIIEIPFTLLFGKAVSPIISVAISLFFVPYSSIYHYSIFENLRKLKPAMATEEKKTGGGFIMASAIVGIALPVLAVAAIVLLAAVGTAHMFRDRGASDFGDPVPGYNAQSY